MKRYFIIVYEESRLRSLSSSPPWREAIRPAVPWLLPPQVTSEQSRSKLLASPGGRQQTQISWPQALRGCAKQQVSPALETWDQGSNIHRLVAAPVQLWAPAEIEWAEDGASDPQRRDGHDPSVYPSTWLARVPVPPSLLVKHNIN